MTAAQAQAALALAIALGLHVGAFALRPGPAGASGSGSGGGDLLSLQAAGPSVAAMVAAWDAPPVTPDLPASPVLPEPAAFAAPQPALPEAPPDLPDLPGLTAPTIAVPVAEAPPQSDTAPALPPAPSTRPKARPQPAAEPSPEPARDPEPANGTGSTAAQVASGSGDGAVAGQGGQAQAPTLSQGRISTLTAEWGATIRSRIERRKRYPMAAEGASGTVTVRLTVTRAGALASLSIAASSGNAALDEAAIKAVRNAGRFPAAPKGLPQDSYSFTLPMRFER